MEDLTLLTLRELGPIFKRSYRTMKRWKASGELPPPIQIGSSKGYRIEQLRELIRKKLGANEGQKGTC